MTKRVTASPATGVRRRRRETATSSTGTTPDAAPKGYATWLAEVKARIVAAQQRAAVSVNLELLSVYWQLGRDILERQASGTWGDGIVDRVAADLRAAFPEMKGFSRSNLKYMRAFAEAWPAGDFGQQAVGQLPWGHNLVLLAKAQALPLPPQKHAPPKRAACRRPERAPGGVSRCSV